MRLGRAAALLAAAGACAACRWTVYASPDHELSALDLFTGAEWGLAQQSFSESFLPYEKLSPRYDATKSTQRNSKCNRDGWGIAWADAQAGICRVKRSGAPPTTKGVVSAELLEHARSAKGTVVFGHIRAATAGGNEDLNSHPFLFNGGRLVWMHNGVIANIAAVLEEVLNMLPDAAKQEVKGQTDSEVAGAIFAANWKHATEEGGLQGAAALEHAMRLTLHDVTFPASASPVPAGDHELVGPFAPCVAGHTSSLNFAASDGRNVVATRFRSCDSEDPPTLYLGTTTGTIADPTGCDFDNPEPRCQLAGVSAGELRADAVWLSSEPLDRVQGAKVDGRDARRKWALLPKDSIVVFDADERRVTVSCASYACEEALLHAGQAAWNWGPLLGVGLVGIAGTLLRRRFPLQRSNATTPPHPGRHD
eukprot:TRINITY_DN64_c0_g1_i2.p1 TRINITY_DN64_c0_g1~~TRINITY_DN64_c0_g1_i2.p1  ORF type:complete len:448 (+),score=125.41 TRINITY_DN64_c0_g1_i2:81-1346(+)